MRIPASIGRACARRLGPLLRAATDVLYPPCCELCDAADLAETADDGSPTGLCGDCIEQVAPPIEHSCLRCGAPVGPHLDTSAGCVHCLSERFAFERVYRLGVYDGTLRSACLRGKTGGGDRLVASLARLLALREEPSLAREQVDVVVAVPQHWLSRLGRTHNTAEVIARVLAGRLKVRFDRHRLMKVRRTRPQSSLPPTERRTNLRGSFVARGGRSFAGRRVLLVDDVLTTGSTAHEAAKALRSAGAAGVVVAVIARGIGQR